MARPLDPETLEATLLHLLPTALSSAPGRDVTGPH